MLSACMRDPSACSYSSWKHRATHTMPSSCGSHIRHLLITPSATQQERHNYYQSKDADEEMRPVGWSSSLRIRYIEVVNPRLLPRDVWSPCPTFQPLHCSAYYPQSPGFLSTQAEGNWETKESHEKLRTREAGKLADASGLEATWERTRQLTACTCSAWSHRSLPPPSVRSWESWDALACRGSNLASLLHCCTFFLSIHILFLFSIDVIVLQIFIEVLLCAKSLSNKDTIVNKIKTCCHIPYILTKLEQTQTNKMLYTLSSQLSLAHK